MRLALIPYAALLPLHFLAGTLKAQEVENLTYTAPDGTHVLRHAIEVPASGADVWEAFTTMNGIRSWAVPVAEELATQRIGRQLPR